MDRGASWLDLTACRLSLIYVPTEANIPILPVAFRNNPKGWSSPPPCLCQVAVLGGDFGLVDAFVNPVFLIKKISRWFGDLIDEKWAVIPRFSCSRMQRRSPTTGAFSAR
jgi:hypothetical protein